MIPLEISWQYGLESPCEVSFGNIFFHRCYAKMHNIPLLNVRHGLRFNLQFHCREFQTSISVFSEILSDFSILFVDIFNRIDISCQT